MRSMDFVRWHNPSQAFTAKHVSYLQLTATNTHMLHLLSYKIIYNLEIPSLEVDLQVAILLVVLTVEPQSSMCSLSAS